MLYWYKNGMKQRLLGYSLDVGTRQSVIREISELLDSGSRNCDWLACFNPHSYVVAKNDAEFEHSLHGATWLVPDGSGVLLAGRILGLTLTERVTGFDIFDGVMQLLDKRAGTVFFLGSTDETLALITRKLPEDYPNVSLSGTYSPPFQSKHDRDELAKMVEAINLAKPDVLWVGMTAPKQEKWIAEVRPDLDVGFAGAIGAVFDFYTGQVKRSPPIFQKLGFEWLPRLLKQPRRLWRRTLISAPVFLYDTIRERFGG